MELWSCIYMYLSPGGNINYKCEVNGESLINEEIKYTHVNE